MANVLVIDDNQLFLDSLTSHIEENYPGLQVHSCNDPIKSLVAIKPDLDLLLVDLEMPRMNGLELTCHVRAHQQTNQVPVIMITSRNTEKHRRLASEAGVNQFLSKPYSEDELAMSIQTQMAS